MRAILRLACITILIAASVSACKSSSSPSDDPASDNTPLSLTGRRFFPADNAWNRDISSDPVDPNSDALISTCGASASLHPDFGTTYLGGPIGIPYVVVHSTQAKVPVTFDY